MAKAGTCESCVFRNGGYCKIFEAVRDEAHWLDKDGWMYPPTQAANVCSKYQLDPTKLD